MGNSGIKKAYETGRGSITIRSRATIEEKNGRNYIVIDEVPYGVNTLDLKNKVADLVHNKVIEGISDYHSDMKNGIKITITDVPSINAYANYQTSKTIFRYYENDDTMIECFFQKI